MATEKKMTMAQIKAISKENVLSAIRGILDEMGAEWVGNTPYIPQTVGDQEVWVEVKTTTKQFTNTKRGEAFDPFIARQAYEFDQKGKEEEAEKRKREREEKKKNSKKSKTEKKEENE